MINFKSIPTNPDILKRDGKLLKAAKVGILLCISYSIFTEFNFIYQSIGQNIDIGFFTKPFKILAAILAISIIEGGGLVALAYLIDRVLKKEIASNKINIVGSVFMVILCYSFAVVTSIGGTQKISNNLVQVPTLLDAEPIENKVSKNLLSINKQFSNDSILIVGGYNSQIDGISKKTDIEKAKLQRSIANYTSKEKREGKSYQSSINWLNHKIGNLESKTASEILNIERKKTDELKALLSDRNSQSKVSTETYTKDKENVLERNKTANKDYLNERSMVYNSMKYGILFSLPLLVACMVVYRNILDKSGIEETSQIDDYFFRESIFNKASNYVRIATLERLHNFFDGKINAIKKKEYSPVINGIYQRENVTKVMNKATHQATAKATHRNVTMQTVVNDNDNKKCLRDGCKTTFKPFPKTKKFCCSNCRIKHHKFELKN